MIDVIDFTALQKRGLLKKYQEEKEIDVLDLRPLASPSIVEPATQIQPTESAFDFLSNFAQSSASGTNTEPNVKREMSDDISLKLDTITNKLDDTMYKLELLSSRLTQIESSLRSFK